MEKYNKIALIMAMEGEAQPIIDHFNLKRVAFHNPIIVYANENESLILSLNGKSTNYGIDNVGTQAATLNAFVVINNYSPNLIINCGTAGGFISQGAEIGDIYIASEKVCFHDRRIDLPGGFTEYGIGNFPVINSDALANTFYLKQGIISSSDSLDYSPQDKEIFEQNKASVKEMEAAAIAWVCKIYHQKFTAIKAITDLVDGNNETKNEFLANFELSTNKLKNKMIDVLNFLLKK